MEIEGTGQRRPTPCTAGLATGRKLSKQCLGEWRPASAAGRHPVSVLLILGKTEGRALNNPASVLEIETIAREETSLHPQNSFSTQLGAGRTRLPGWEALCSLPAPAYPIRLPPISPHRRRPLPPTTVSCQVGERPAVGPAMDCPCGVPARRHPVAEAGCRLLLSRLSWKKGNNARAWPHRIR
jgi:hypothetical protein